MVRGPRCISEASLGQLINPPWYGASSDVATQIPPGLLLARSGTLQPQPERA